MFKGTIKFKCESTLAGFTVLTGNTLYVAPSGNNPGLYYFHFEDQQEWYDDSVSPSTFRKLYDDNKISIVKQEP
mgnify:CR=1 FL=1